MFHNFDSLFCSFHFVLFLFCFTFHCYHFHLVLFIYFTFNLFLYYPNPSSVSTSISVVKYIGCEPYWVSSLSSLRCSKEQAHWWPWIHPSGFRISVARHSTPPYSSIRPSSDWGHWGLSTHLWKVLNPLAAPITLLGYPVLFNNTLGTVSVTLNWCTSSKY